MTHNFVFNTDCFASQKRKTQHNTTHTLRGRKPLSCSIHWRLILFMLFSSMMFSPFESNGQTDTLICDNGGFEDDFLNYYAYDAYFNYGSSTCTPLNLSYNPSFFQLVSPPIFRWFEIVSNGTDPLTQYSTVKFGSKALLLGNRYGRFSDCDPGRRVHKIVKRFIVNEANRNFTFWYSVALHNPDDVGHIDSQPFFSVKCDLATNSNLCYDGITYPSNIFSYPSGDCYPDEEPFKSTNWACHRVFIDKEYIGQIATIEISVAGCGFGKHFGYAFIDGFCESCDGGSYGSGTLGSPGLVISCNGDSITLSGSYTTPTIQGNYSILHDITVPGFNIYGKSINSGSNTFNFRILKSDFQSPHPDCRDVIAYLDFKNSAGDHLPLVPTNSVEICFDDFVLPDVDITIGGCNRNNPNNNIYSDDYYYVNFEIANAGNIHWTLERLLDDALPGESGNYFLNTTGYGNGNYNLGPFLIQEGSWILILNYNHCSDTFHITPPDYCSGCAGLAKAKIFDIACTQGNNWSYKIMIPPNPNVQNESYFINGQQYFFGQINTIPVGVIGDLCSEVLVDYYIGAQYICTATFDICPPRKCADNQGCFLEAYLKKLNCINNGSSYSIELNVKGANSPCFKAFDNIGNLINSGSFNNPLGNYSQDITLKLYTCGNAFGCNCTTNCYKLLKIRRPMDCNRSDFGGGASTRLKKRTLVDLSILPNPVNADEFTIKSNLKTTSFEIINTAGITIYSSSFEGKENKVNLKLPSGVYILKYKNQFQENSVLKFIKS